MPRTVFIHLPVFAMHDGKKKVKEKFNVTNLMSPTIDWLRSKGCKEIEGETGCCLSMCRLLKFVWHLWKILSQFARIESAVEELKENMSCKLRRHLCYTFFLASFCLDELIKVVLNLGVTLLPMHKLPQMLPAGTSATSSMYAAKKLVSCCPTTTF